MNNDPLEQLYFLMTYECWRCEENWTMVHDSACDDRCPNCNTSNAAITVSDAP